MDKTQSIEEDRCFHCSEPLGAQAVKQKINDAEHAFCCAGCLAAAHWIQDHGLSQYYRLRTQTGNRIASDANDDSQWLDPQLIAENVDTGSTYCETQLVIDGIRCSACAWLIDRALNELSGVEYVSVNASNQRALVRWNPQQVQLITLISLLRQLGFAAHWPYSSALEQQRLSDRRKLLMRLGVAGLGMVQAMMFSEALYLDTQQQMPTQTRDVFRWLSFLLTTPVVFYSGWPFLLGMWREIRYVSLGMNSLIGSGVLLAYVGSTVQIVRGGEQVWFDAAVMFVFFLLTSRFIEQSAKDRASSKLDMLAAAQNLYGWIVRAGERTRVPAADIRIGESVDIAVGESCPVDGALISEFALVDESVLSGESAPIEKVRGDSILAGSRVFQSPIRVDALRTGQQTQMAQLRRLIDQAHLQKPAFADTAQRVASVFVVALLVVSIAVYFIWIHIDPDRAFEIMLATIVVTCPCALTLAIPASLSACLDAMAIKGINCVNADAIQRLAGVTQIAFDKTGTLTTDQRAQLVGVPASDYSPQRVFALARSLQSSVNHPLSAAFDRGAKDDKDIHIRQATIHPGLGISATINELKVRIGRADFVAGQVDDGHIWLSVDHRAIATFSIQERIREDAKRTIASFRAEELPISLLSGDADERVQRCAQTLGIDHWLARLTPEQKLQAVRDMQTQHQVLMIGDGINDAPVLAAANVSIAVASGTAVAKRAADFLLIGRDLYSAFLAYQLAKQCRKLMVQNLSWAIAYNLIALPLAVMGLIGPGLAAAGMALSSLLVTVNALRIGRNS